MDHGCYFTDLIGLVGSQDSASIVSWVVSGKPDSTSTACVRLAIVEAGSICVNGDILVAHVESVGVIACCWEVGDPVWVGKYSEAFCQAVFVGDQGVEEDLAVIFSCDGISGFSTGGK